MSPEMNPRRNTKMTAAGPHHFLPFMNLLLDLVERFRLSVHGEEAGAVLDDEYLAESGNRAGKDDIPFPDSADRRSGRGFDLHAVVLHVDVEDRVPDRSEGAHDLPPDGRDQPPRDGREARGAFPFPFPGTPSLRLPHLTLDPRGERPHPRHRSAEGLELLLLLFLLGLDPREPPRLLLPLRLERLPHPLFPGDPLLRQLDLALDSGERVLFLLLFGREAAGPLRLRGDHPPREVPKPLSARLRGDQSRVVPLPAKGKDRRPIQPLLRACPLLLDGADLRFGLPHFPGKLGELPVDPRDEDPLAGKPLPDVVHLVARRLLALQGFVELGRRLLRLFAQLGKTRLLFADPGLRTSRGGEARDEQKGGDQRCAESGFRRRAENPHHPLGKAPRPTTRWASAWRIAAARRNRAAGRATRASCNSCAGPTATRTKEKRPDRKNIAAQDAPAARKASSPPGTAVPPRFIRRGRPMTSPPERIFSTWGRGSIASRTPPIPSSDIPPGRRRISTYPGRGVFPGRRIDSRPGW